MDSDPDLALAIKRSLEDQKTGRGDNPSPRMDPAGRKKANMIDLTESDDEDDELHGESTGRDRASSVFAGPPARPEAPA